MAIDLRKVEPLGSKSVLLEQALKRHRNQNNKESDLHDMSDMVTPDYEWLNEDKSAIQGLIQQMDTSIGQLAMQMRDVEDMTDKTRQKMEKEQQLLFKQIKTLNSLLKKQVDVFSAMDRQIEQVELNSQNLLPQVGIGLIAGLMSAVTIIATAPWMTVFIENIRG